MTLDTWGSLLTCDISLSGSHPLGLDRSLDQGRRSPLCRIRGRVLCAFMGLLGIRRRHLWWCHGWCSASLRDHGLLHLHEDGRNHQAQGGGHWSRPSQHLGYIHGHLSPRGYPWYQQGCQCSSCQAMYELGISVSCLHASHVGEC